MNGVIGRVLLLAIAVACAGWLAGAAAPLRAQQPALSALERSDRDSLESTARDWIAFREYNGLMLYYSQIATYRCGIREFHLGIDKTAPDRTIPLASCNPHDPHKVGPGVATYMMLPATAKFVTAQITYRDGSKSQIMTFRRPVPVDTTSAYGRTDKQCNPLSMAPAIIRCEQKHGYFIVTTWSTEGHLYEMAVEVRNFPVNTETVLAYLGEEMPRLVHDTGPAFSRTDVKRIIDEAYNKLPGKRVRLGCYEWLAWKEDKELRLQVTRQQGCL